jgi:hypothetical protein
MDTIKRTTNISELNENQRRRFYFEKNFPELLLKIDEFNKKYKIDNFSELLYRYHNDLTMTIKCKICNKKPKFISFNKGFNKYCSRKCTMSDKEIINKRNKKSLKTNLERWGVDNPMKVDEIKNKVKKTNLERWGVEHYTQTDEYKDRIIEKNQEKWGVDWYQQSDEFKNKSIKSYLERYGETHHMKNKKFLEKVKEENINRWGVDNFTKTKSFKKIMYEYYKSVDFIENINIQKEFRKIKEMEFYNNYNKNYSLIEIVDDNLTLSCPDCNKNFNINKQLYYLRNKNNQVCCTICNKTNGSNTSFEEKELLKFIKEVYDGEIVENYKNKYEIDIYLPELKLGFEFNGLWYHSEKYKEASYHQNKTFYFNKIDIKIFHIWEDDWIYKKDIIKSMIKYKINKTDIKIGARQCYIKEIDNNTSKKFLNDNHLQGYVKSSIKIGLFYKNELVSLITLGRSRNKSKETEILRFCNKINTSVNGSFTKLLKHFTNNYEFNKLITYADISHSDGNLYLKNGFKYDKITDIGYYWCNNGLKYNRFRFRKDKLLKEGYNPNKTEKEIMHERGYYRLYNCGNYKFIYYSVS